MIENYKLTLKEIKYLQTPDLSVDLISSSKWSRITKMVQTFVNFLYKSEC